MNEPPQIGAMYINKNSTILKLIGVSKCSSVINDRQCNICDHNILHLATLGQVCPVDAFGIPLWRRITKTNERW